MLLSFVSEMLYMLQFIKTLVRVCEVVCMKQNILYFFLGPIRNYSRESNMQDLWENIKHFIDGSEGVGRWRGNLE